MARCVFVFLIPLIRGDDDVPYVREHFQRVDLEHVFENISVACPPLVSAAIEGDTERVRALLADGADPNLACSEETALPEFSPLHGAAGTGEMACVELLLEAGAAIDRGAHNLTPLFQAVISEQLEAATTLLEHGADANTALEDGSTPLFIASLRCARDLVALLFEHGADPNARASGGETAMDSVIKAHKESLKGEGAAPEFQGIDEANCLAVGNMLVNRGFLRPEL